MSEHKFEIILEPDALIDIQDAIDYYENEQSGLGIKFEQALNKLFLSLEKSPFYAVRYDEVLCLPMKKFPYMIHYTLNEPNFNFVVRAVLHTSLNPAKWKR